jgi:hypothetical protein
MKKRNRVEMVSEMSLTKELSGGGGFKKKGLLVASGIARSPSSLDGQLLFIKVSAAQHPPYIR